MEVNRQFLNVPDCEDLGITREKPKHPRYAVISKRTESFRTWPEDAPISTEALVDAGFAYTGKYDAVRCFYCNGGLRKWQRGDDPWVEHARYYSTCPYVLLVKGQDFIDRVTGSLESDVPSATGTSDSGDHLSTAAAQSCLQMGFSEERVLMAIKTYIEARGSTNFRGEDICEILLTYEYDQGEATRADLHRGEECCGANVSDSKSRDLQHDGASDEALQEENQRLREKRACKICLEGVASIIFLPCGHMVSCPQCAPALASCPMCRCDVSGFVKAYFDVS